MGNPNFAEIKTLEYNGYVIERKRRGICCHRICASYFAS